MKENNNVDNAVENRTYTSQDIMIILNIGQNAVYDFLRYHENRREFRVFRIGKLYRVDRLSFDEWFYNNAAS